MNSLTSVRNVASKPSRQEKQRTLVGFFRARWRYALLLFFLLLVAFAALNWTFDKVVVDDVEMAEEAAKLLSAYILSLASLGFSHIIESRRTSERCKALRTLVIDQVGTRRQDLEKLQGIDPDIYSPVPVEDLKDVDAKRKLFTDLSVDLAESLQKTCDRLLDGDERCFLGSRDLIAIITYFNRTSLRHHNGRTPDTAKELGAAASSILKVINGA